MHEHACIGSHRAPRTSQCDTRKPLPRVSIVQQRIGLLSCDIDVHRAACALPRKYATEFGSGSGDLQAHRFLEGSGHSSGTIWYQCASWASDYRTERANAPPIAAVPTSVQNGGKADTRVSSAIPISNAMTLDEALARLDFLGNERMRAQKRMVRSVSFVQVADWLNACVVKKHSDKEKLRQRWMATDDTWAARAGWSLTAECIAKDPEGLDLPALLAHIESEMGRAVPEVQWTMNFCLAGIRIHFPKHRKRAIAIGETLGLYRDYPLSKGCTSPFAPIWIDEMVHRQG
jgi:3-methyladenine DNA glycosylase AlkD